MRAVKVTFADGNTITTGINGTEKEIRDYYAIGNMFNLGTGADGEPEDNIQKVTALEFLN
jgi:hypothetical protein